MAQGSRQTCPSCLRDAPPGTAFCGHCGAALDEQTWANHVPAPKPRGSGGLVASIAFIVVGGVVLGIVANAVLGARPGTSATSRAAGGAPPQAQAPEVAPFSPVTVTGSGYTSTAPFTLPGGDFRVTTGVVAGKYGCYHGARLVSADGSVSQTIASKMIDTAGAIAIDGYVYGLPAGAYHVEPTSGCESFTTTFSR